MTGLVIAAGATLDLPSLARRGEQLAAGLAALGVGEGDVVAALLRNGMPYLELIQACRRLGCYYCPINWHFTAGEVAYLVEDSGAKVLIAGADLHDRIAHALQPGLPVLRVADPAARHDPARPAWRDYDAWRDSHAPYAGPAVAPRGHMAYTSGTTGRPKGVVRQPFPLAELARRQAGMNAVVERAYGLREGARALLPAPIYHSAPSVFAQMALRLCERFVVTQRFDPVEVLELIARHRIDTVYMVPIMYVRLLKLAPAVRAAYDLSSVRFVACTGAPCAPDVKRAMIEWFGPVIHETYASSETGMVTAIDSAQALAKPGSVGLPIGDAVVRIYGPDGAVCAPGQVGRIYVRQPVYADFTYRGNPQARAAVERDGLIGLGDLGYLDEDGFLFVCDRESDMVISGGVNIYPAEIEQHLLQFPGVADCAVIGVPDDEYGERLLALLQPAPGSDIAPQAVGQWLAARVAGYKVPRDIRVEPQLPRDDSGKIAKRKLRAAHWSGRDRKV